MCMYIESMAECRVRYSFMARYHSIIEFIIKQDEEEKINFVFVVKWYYLLRSFYYIEVINSLGLPFYENKMKKAFAVLVICGILDICF